VNCGSNGMCLRQRVGGLGLLSLTLATCAQPSSGPAPAGGETSESAGGESGHHGHGHGHGHGHDGATACHGRGAEGDFSDAECFARMFDAPERDAWQHPDEVVSLLAVTAGLTVADLGAGTGYFESRLSAAVGAEGHVLALDVAPEMVAYMTERFTREGLTNVEARQVGFESAGLAPASVDRILVVDTWHHVENRLPYARELAAALREGGTLTIVDFTMESPEGPPVAMRLSAESVIEELSAAGLRAELVTESLPHQWIVRGAR
jgi:SAM-dependent methyltransferase